MPSIKLVSWAELVSQGGIHFVKQGAASDEDRNRPLTITVNGDVKHVADESLADAAGVNLWTSSDNPSSFALMALWTEGQMALQIIDASNHVVLRTGATIPLILGGTPFQILCTTGTTALSADPTLATPATIRLWNDSGGPLGYLAAFIE